MFSCIMNNMNRMRNLNVEHDYKYDQIVVKDETEFGNYLN